MSIMQPFHQWLGLNTSKLTEEQKFLLEAEIFSRICEELKEAFRKNHREFFDLLRFNTEMENIMLESKFVRLIIQDILATGEYNLRGVACYTDTHEEVLEEIITERNLTPSAVLLRKLLNLHRSVRPLLYEEIIKKVSDNYHTAA